MQPFEKATGPIEVKLVNDLLFRMLLQKNKTVLKALIASLLHLKLDEILSVIIENEHLFGDSIDEKEFVLDVRVSLNNQTIINLEMQVVNLHNWTERSLSYLSRSFDTLARGQDYRDVKTAIQIGFLDYTLFPDRPEFYATYYMSNEKTHEKYSDKFRLSVLDLTRIDLATEEDKLYGIDHWATLFKAQTWEELKMLAKNNEVMTEAVSTIYSITQDELMREKLRAREDALIHEQYMQKALEDRDVALAEKDAEIARLKALLEEKNL